MGLSAKESLLELLAVEGAGDSLPATLRSGVDVAEGSMSTPIMKIARYSRNNLETFNTIMSKVKISRQRDINAVR